MNGSKFRGLPRAAIAYAALSLAVVASPGSAHHAASAYFDLREEVTVTGRVDELVFRAPHAVLRFIVDECGEETLWRAETLPSNLLYHRGWRYNMFEPGLEVTVTGNPSRNPELNALNLIRVETGDGRIVTGAGIESAD